MANPWDAECIVSPELAASLVAEQCPTLAGAPLRLLGAGFDNTAFLVDDTWVFRFPRRQVAVALLEAETRLLPTIAPLVPLAVPVPVHRGHPTERYPWPFAGYRHLSGHTACALDLDDHDRARAAPVIARFLRALHDLRDVALEGDTIGRMEVDRRAPRARDQLHQLAALGLIANPDRWLPIQNGPHRAPRTDTLVHGDLYARHLVLDHHRVVSGVIDWGDAHRGDPACDLAVAHAFLPPRAHDAFRHPYGPIDDDTWALARCRALQHQLTVVLYAHDARDRDLLREGLRALAHLAT